MEEKQKELKTYLLNLVAKKEYTRHQLSEKAEKRYPDTDPTGILDEFEERKFVSDQRFAELYTRQAIAKGSGPMKIQQKLYEKGVGKGIASQVIADQYPYELQLEKAQEVAQKKRVDSKEKLQRFLMSRGFGSDVVYAVLNTS